MAASARELIDLIPKEHGYVVLVLVCAFFVHMWMSFRVGAARKKYDVKYPKMYSETCDEFNCIQRAHQNTVCETYPLFIPLLLSAGIKFPVIAAGLGAVFLFGRVLYFIGYSTGDPAKRNMGAPFYLPGYLGLVVVNIIFAVTLIL